MLRTCSVLYTSLVSFEALLFSNANWIVSSDYRSINMSVASLLGQMRIAPHSSGSSRPSFFTQKVQDFGVPKLIFDTRAFAFVAES